MYSLAVILPSPYSGGVVRSLVNICRMLAIGAKAKGDDLRLTVGVPESQSWSPVYDELLSIHGIQRRTFLPRTMAHGKLVGAFRALGIEVAKSEDYVVFDDGLANFEDSDFWYLISDSLDNSLPPHRKYGCMIYDYANRYYPEIFDENQWRKFQHRAAIAQNASFVVTTTRQTRIDAINFAGVQPEKVNILPLEFDPLQLDESQINLPSFGEGKKISFLLWPTILSGHENHLAVLNDLQQFLIKSDLHVVIVGKGTRSLDPSNSRPEVDHPYINSIRRVVSASSILRERLVFLDYVSDGSLLALMRESVCVMHTSMGDNGSYVVLEAAWQGVPSISNRYPAMQEISEYFGLPLEFFDFYVPKSLSEGLERLLAKRESICQHLPTREDLSKFSFEHVAVQYWEKISRCIQHSLQATP